MPKPVGSGRLARKVGVGFLAAAPVVLILHYLHVAIPPIYVLFFWLLASGSIAFLWGNNRIKKGDQNDNTIGMDTINMIVAMLGVTFAVAALVADAHKLQP